MADFDVPFVLGENIEVKKDDSLLEPGWYEVTCTEAELKTTKAGSGKYVKATLVTDNGRYVWTMFNVINPNPEAERIGKQQLASFMTAAGLQKLPSTDAMIGARVSAKIAIKKDEDYGDQNVVKAYKKVGKDKPAKEDDDTPIWLRS